MDQNQNYQQNGTNQGGQHFQAYGNGSQTSPQQGGAAIPVMKAPESESKYTRKDKGQILKIQPGNHLGRLYGIVNIGHQLQSRFNKHTSRIVLLFEFPHLMQDFYERKPGEPAEFKPTMIKKEMTFSMHEKAGFRKFVETGLAKRLSDQEAKDFNAFSLLGMWFNCNVMHDPDKKDANNVYERINFIQPYDERFKVQGVNYNGINELMAYDINFHGFQGAAWQSLWNKFRQQVISSQEGQEYANKGGKFEEVKYNDDNDRAQTNSYTGPAAPTGNGMQMGQAPTGQGFQNPQQGQGPWEKAGYVPEGQPVQQQQPAQQGWPMGHTNAYHQAQQNPQQGQPVQQQQAPVPQAAPAMQQQQVARKLVIKTQPHDINQWLSGGWTEDLMVQQGHAEWIESPV